MLNSTTKTYILKREILNFSKKISRTLSKPERKFAADMIYGMLAVLWSSFFVALLAKKISLFDYAATLASCGVA